MMETNHNTVFIEVARNHDQQFISLPIADLTQMVGAANETVVYTALICIACRTYGFKETFDKKFWASNYDIEDITLLHKDTIRNCLNKLQDKGFISINTKYDKYKNIKMRIVSLSKEKYIEKSEEVSKKRKEKREKLRNRASPEQQKNEQLDTGTTDFVEQGQNSVVQRTKNSSSAGRMGRHTKKNKRERNKKEKNKNIFSKENINDDCSTSLRNRNDLNSDSIRQDNQDEEPSMSESSASRGEAPKRKLNRRKESQKLNKPELKKKKKVILKKKKSVSRTQSTVSDSSKPIEGDRKSNKAAPASDTTRSSARHSATRKKPSVACPQNKREKAKSDLAKRNGEIDSDEIENWINFYKKQSCSVNHKENSKTMENIEKMITDLTSGTYKFLPSGIFGGRKFSLLDFKKAFETYKEYLFDNNSEFIQNGFGKKDKLFSSRRKGKVLGLDKFLFVGYPSEYSLFIQFLDNPPKRRVQFSNEEFAEKLFGAYKAELKRRGVNSPDKNTHLYDLPCRERAMINKVYDFAKEFKKNYPNFDKSIIRIGEDIVKCIPDFCKNMHLGTLISKNIEQWLFDYYKQKGVYVKNKNVSQEFVAMMANQTGMSEQEVMNRMY